MRLLLDEMWAPAIARELRERGFDAIAIGEVEHAGRYAGVSDHEVFARAQDEGRTIVTDNVSDYEQARREWETRDAAHHGLVYALDPPFNRHRGGAVGPIVRALEQFVASPPEDEPLNRVHFLRTATRS